MKVEKRMPPCAMLCLFALWAVCAARCRSRLRGTWPAIYIIYRYIQNAWNPVFGVPHSECTLCSHWSLRLEQATATTNVQAWRGEGRPPYEEEAYAVGVLQSAPFEESG